ncbi:Deoxyribonucleoside regulator [Candidatus Thermoflexus japonica]|uniref:Deoxyribonucleoside regulator n=1 Tax=Candidatus Thermoflexus japonica TaxID=2035417 RepID=A0A2H5Y9Z6_9CHLR|nr:Deoxyribonucleoside regulator [Candidatus Thermoflexus japonica]
MPRKSSKRFPSREELLAHVASLYYEQGWNQSRIAKALGFSRSMVSRLLSEARQRKIVQISIHWPIRTVKDLEDQLVATFGLRTARVLDVENLPYPELLSRLGKLAALELVRYLRDGMTIAVTWGITLWELVQALPPQVYPRLRVVQCLGALGGTHPCDTPAIVRRLAETLGAQGYYLHAPLMVESEQTCQQLLQERMIKEVLDLARQADLLLVGIGSTESEVSSLKRSGSLSEEDLAWLRRQGAVGYLCARYLDLNGQPIPTPFDRRTIGLTLEEIRRIPCVFAVAGGTLKARAILAALRSGLINILVTDKGAAAEALRIHAADRREVVPRRARIVSSSPPDA